MKPRVALLAAIAAALIAATAFAAPRAGTFAAALPSAAGPLAKQAEFHYAAFRVLPVFDIALYSEGQGEDAYPLHPDKAIALAFHYHRTIAAEDLVAAAEKALRELLTPAEGDALGERIARLSAAYEDVAAGDRYTLLYEPGRGTTLRRGETEVATIPGFDFASAYFGIWLGEHSASKRLRRALLKRRPSNSGRRVRS